MFNLTTIKTKKNMTEFENKKNAILLLFFNL